MKTEKEIREQIKELRKLASLNGINGLCSFKHGVVDTLESILSLKLSNFPLTNQQNKI